MAQKKDKPSLFDRAMSLADRFFERVEKFKKMSDEAQKQNIEILDVLYQDFKESAKQELRSAVELANESEANTGKLLMGKELHLWLEKEQQKLDSKPSLDDQLHAASVKAINTQNKKGTHTKESFHEH